MPEPESARKHKEEEKKALIAIIAMSDTRSVASDESGNLAKELLEKAGHKVVEHIVLKDEEEALHDEIQRLLGKVDAIISNGGTGITRRDITVETVEKIFEKKLASFQTLFATLSYHEVGSAATLSRATAGIAKNTVIFALPGSKNAVKLGIEKLIIPELGHILKHMND